MSRAMATGLLLCVVLLTGSALAADRAIVMEHFTNAGCGPCYTNDPWINQFIDDHPRLVVASYHVSWPWSGDPFYQANIPENSGRTSFYNVTGVPHIRFNGNREPVYPYTVANLEATYNGLNMTSPARINLSGTYTPVRGDRAGTGTLTVEVIAEQSFSGTDKRIVIVLCEDNNYYPAPNGILWHHRVMRDMIPDEDGTPVDLSGPYPDTEVVEVDFTISPSWEEENLYFAVMLQVFGGLKKIRQGGKIELVALQPTDVATDGDLAGVSGVTLGRNFPNPCNPTTVFPVSVTGEGRASLRIYDVEGRLVRDVFAARLSAGSHTIEWDGRDASGARVSSGIYYARFEAEQEVQARKLVVIR